MPVAIYLTYRLTYSRTCRVIIALFLALFLAGCATTTTAKLPSGVSAGTRAEIPAMHDVSEFNDDEPAGVIADPWEEFNRSMYRFNYRFDKYLFLPVVSGYELITPTLVQKGVSNFFFNVDEIRTLYNSLFQLQGEKSLTTFGRFLTNSTIGIGGLFDLATPLGMKKQNENFGQTLGYWGVHHGPYLVVPVLGPNSLRSAGGFAVDTGIRFAMVSVIDPYEGIGNDVVMAGISTLEGIDTRHKEEFRYYDSDYPFEYEIVRFIYHERERLLLMK